jgi:hypothetical protein
MSKIKNKNANRQFIDSAILNNETYMDFLNRLCQVAVSQFEWVNLPSSMNAEYLERCLYLYGKASLLKTENYGFINAQAVSNGDLNIYMLPSKINCFSVDSLNEDRINYNGFKKDEEDEYKYAILVKNNPFMIPTEPTLQLFALRLYEAERTSDVNIKAQKTPTLIVGDESLKLAMKNLFEKYDGNEPVIYADKKQLGSDSIRCLKTEAPFIADKIMEYKKEIWNEALTFLGINNINVEKKERLVSEEAGANNELVNLNLQARLSCRKEACKKFNELFGLTGENAIDVRVRSDLNNMIKKYDSIVSEYNEKEGDENV